jgi:predicted ATP-grasp superfamily ATP-dependent carboligase
MTAILIAAASGRALAASARRGGFVPLVADYFGDQDTLDAAQMHVRLEDSLAHGMEADALLAALARLAAGETPAGLVWGTGFEDRPHLLAEISRRWRLIGNTPETVTAVKEPLRLATLCRDCGIPHPETSWTPPTNPDGWLAKRQGGAGGSHIVPAIDYREAKAGIYFQQGVTGTPVSALFLADGQHARVLGFSTQWVSPTIRQPFRYGGAVRPAGLAAKTESALARAVARIASAVPLVGLNSADFLVDGQDFQLLEINPRPGATLDIFEPDHGSLFAMHVAACVGDLPDRVPAYAEAAASAIVYADRDIGTSTRDWPAWTADRPQAEISIRAGEPYCTVLARAPTAAEAKRLVERRQHAILASANARAA